jgi:signal peptide peptidase SppA
MLTLDNLQAAGVPYLDQWFGLWCMHEPTMLALYSRLKGIDVGAHLSGGAVEVTAGASPSRKARPRATSAGRRPRRRPPAGGAKAETVTQYVRRGYSYEVVDGVALLSAEGTLMKHESSADESTSTVMLRNTVRRMTSDPLVRGVIAVVSSPGGTVAGAYDLADDFAMLSKAKPFYTYAQDICCSAAYLLASQTRGISANRNALVGSIGTYGVVWDSSKMFADAGVKVHVIRGSVDGKPAPLKGAGEPGTEITDEQLAAWQEQIDQMNELFIGAVVRGRKMDRAKVEKLADGNAHVGDSARKLGLVDKVESLDELFARVRKEVGGASSATRLESTGSITGNDLEGRARREADGPTQATENPGGDQQTNSDPATDASADVGDAGPEPLSTEESDMSQKQDAGTAGGAAPAPAEPKAATMAELKASCPGAPSDFLVEQAEKGATVAQAKDAFLGWQAAQIRARDAELTKLQAAKPPEQQAADPAPAAAKKAPGVPALESKGPKNDAGSGGDFKAQVEALVKGGMPRDKAVSKVAREDPEAHQAYIDAANAKK